MHNALRQVRQTLGRNHDSAEGAQQDPEQVRDGEGCLRPDGAGDQEPERSEGGSAENQEAEARKPTFGPWMPAEQRGDGADHQDLEDQDCQDGDDLAGNESGPAQGVVERKRSTP